MAILRRRNRPTPEEFRIKASTMARQLEKRETTSQRKTDEARVKAKDALRRGDDRGYTRAARRFGMAHQQLELVMAQRDMAENVVDGLEAQEGMKEIVGFGDQLTSMQKDMGIDVDKMKQSLERMQLGMERVARMTDTFMTTVEAAMVDPGRSEIGEQLKAELMAELESETGYESQIAETIRADASEPELAERA